MAHALRSSDRALAAGTIWPLRRARGHRIACVDGELWITVDGELEDYFVEPGETFVIVSDARVVVYAVRDSVFQLTAPAAATRRHGWRNALRNAFA